MTSKNDFKGRVVIVTGASRGIGKAITSAFASAGASLALCARDELALKDVAQGLGSDTFHSKCDVTSDDEVRRFVHAVHERFGKIDILVNNAGDTSSALLTEMDNDFWQRILAVNLTGVFLMTRETVPLMISQQYGRIVNIASMSAKRGSRYLGAYSAAKHGVLGFTQSIALEVVERGVMINAVCPGYVDTPGQKVNVENMMRDRGLSEEAVRELMAHKNARGRFISMDEVAETVLSLSEEGLNITGQAVDLW